jgi:hypothetical protein
MRKGPALLWRLPALGWVIFGCNHSGSGRGVRRYPAGSTPTIGKGSRLHPARPRARGSPRPLTSSPLRSRRSPPLASPRRRWITPRCMPEVAPPCSRGQDHRAPSSATRPSSGRSRVSATRSNSLIMSPLPIGCGEPEAVYPVFVELANPPIGGCRSAWGRSLASSSPRGPGPSSPGWPAPPPRPPPAPISPSRPRSAVMLGACLR